MKRQIIIGIVFLVSIGLLYWGINFLKGLDVFSTQRVFYAEYDNVSGLLVANPVTVSGYRIGQVADISFKKDEPSKLIVKFFISENIDIPANTIARIESSDLLGSKAIVLHLGNSTKYAKSADFFKGEMETSIKDEVSLQMLPLKIKVESLLSSFDSALVVVQYIFNENTRENISKSFESISRAINNIEGASSTLDTLLNNQQYRLANIVNNIEAITLNIKNNNQQIDNIISNFSKLSDTLLVSHIQSTFKNADEALFELSQIMKTINSGEGTMGALVNNDSLYKKLFQASEEMDLLLEDMRLNPQRYLHFSVFGKGKNKYTPPSNK